MKEKFNLDDKIKKNLNIVHVITRPDSGGAEFLVRELSSYLFKKGFNVTTIYFYNPSKVHLKNYEYCLNLSGPKDLRAIWFIRKRLIDLTQKKKTIVHAHLTSALYFLPIASFGLKTINFYTEHNTYNRRRNYPFLKPIENYIYSKYNKIICISKGTKKNLLTWLGAKFNNKNILAIPNGSRLFNVVRRKKIDPKKLRLVSVGSLSNQKGFDIAIRTIFLLKDSIHRYTIVGEGDQKERLSNLAVKLGIRHKIFLTGHVKNIKPYLSNADIGLVPSRWEGFGLVSIEMLSTGLPLVCSNVIGLREVVSKCQSVELMRPESSKALARGILKTIKLNENIRKNKITLNARKHSEKFDIKFFCEKYTNFYVNTVLSNKFFKFK